MGRAGPRSSLPPGPRPPSPSITSLGKYLLLPPGAAAGCFLFVPGCKQQGGGGHTSWPLGSSGGPRPLCSPPSGSGAQRPSPLPSVSRPPSLTSLFCVFLSPVSSSFIVCLPRSLPPWTQPPGASAHLLLSPSTAQEVLGLQGHPSQGPDEAAGHWRGAQE